MRPQLFLCHQECLWHSLFYQLLTLQVFKADWASVTASSCFLCAAVNAFAVAFYQRRVVQSRQQTNSCCLETFFWHRHISSCVSGILQLTLLRLNGIIVSLLRVCQFSRRRIWVICDRPSSVNLPATIVLPSICLVLSHLSSILGRL